MKNLSSNTQHTGSISVDTIYEATPGSGVFIDGAVIKDGKFASISWNANEHVKTNGSSETITVSTATLAAQVGAYLFPVGSYYINETNSTNPATLLGFGTWVAVQNRTIVGKGSGTFATAGSTGGAETHTLTVNEMPSHSHAYNGTVIQYTGAGGTQAWNLNSGTTASEPLGTQSTGNGQPHNNMPPYIVAFIWKRVS